MRIWFLQFINAFHWRAKLSFGALLRFIGLSVLAYALLVGLMMVGLQLILLTPVIERLTAPGVMAFTSGAVKVFMVVVFIPVGLHSLKTLVYSLVSRF